MTYSVEASEPAMLRQIHGYKRANYSGYGGRDRAAYLLTDRELTQFKKVVKRAGGSATVYRATGAGPDHPHVLIDSSIRGKVREKWDPIGGFLDLTAALSRGCKLTLENPRDPVKISPPAAEGTEIA